jgi:hypothetical protein
MRDVSAPEPCVICQAQASGHHCPRCGLPVCTAHIPSNHERCWNCEGTYHDRRATRGDKLAFWVPYGLVWLGFALATPTLISMGNLGGVTAYGFSTGIPLLDAIIAAALISLGLGFAGRWIRNRVLRRRFLAE